MNKEKSNDTKPNVGKWGLVKAKTRNWIDEEVSKAIEYLKHKVPEIWCELERLEVTTGDLRRVDAADIELATLKELHPECEFNEISQLFGKMLAARRASLGLM